MRQANGRLYCKASQATELENMLISCRAEWSMLRHRLAQNDNAEPYGVPPYTNGERLGRRIIADNAVRTASIATHNIQAEAYGGECSHSSRIFAVNSGRRYSSI